MLVVMIACSNFVAILTAYKIGNWFIPHIHTDAILHIGNNIDNNLLPLYDIKLPKLISNEMALLIGAICGLITAIGKVTFLNQLSAKLLKIVNLVLNKGLIPAIPVFILGYMLKLAHDNMLNILLKDFAPLLILIILLQHSYIGLIYLITNKFNIKKCLAKMKNNLPAAFVGFTTMSSAAAMPTLIKSTEENLADPKLAQAVVPPIVNVHMLGDCLGIPLMGLLIYLNYYGTLPGPYAYLLFAIHCVWAKFAAAGVPGGSVIVIIPVLEQYLQFNGEMSGIIFAMYILFDPFCTMANIMGNGAFPLLFEKTWRLYQKSFGNEVVQYEHQS